ncbi:PD-(D/E)XK nuclease family transposase [Butyrivibrio sp. LB2008]|uniref:PD-(D/E)XK nuclease family transposase n=1 Tax=Butyrivibrio sp. LB2008 TaxID=1408305 RepID=UPI00068919BE|nr:PD-(D/E)XK nuclease family transposase [Butyrivibrio sp. LB2008]
MIQDELNDGYSSRAKQQESDRVRRIIDDLTLFDDDMMSLVFDKNIPATQLLLRIILKRDIIVKSVKGQEEFKNPIVGGRDITLDIHAIDIDGEEIDIEVQGNYEGSHVRRARFHSAMLDSRMLRESDVFKSLKDSYVIFIYKHDKFKKGLPIYSADRTIMETGEALNDGAHIIYVNGTYTGNDEFGKLMQDFHSRDSKEMHYKELANSVHHFKETKKGREIMCEAVKKYAEEYAKEYAEEYIIKDKVITVQKLMKNMKWTLEQTLDNIGVSDKAERDNIISLLKKG